MLATLDNPSSRINHCIHESLRLSPQASSFDMEPWLIVLLAVNSQTLLVESVSFVLLCPPFTNSNWILGASFAKRVLGVKFKVLYLASIVIIGGHTFFNAFWSCICFLRCLINIGDHDLGIFCCIVQSISFLNFRVPNDLENYVWEIGRVFRLSRFYGWYKGWVVLPKIAKEALL